MEYIIRHDANTANLHEPAAIEQLQFAPLLEVMEITGLLEREGAYWKARPLPFARESAAEGHDEKPVIAMDTAFSFVLYPEISLGDALALSAFCSVKETFRRKKNEPAAAGNSAVCFELTRESVIRGFDQGVQAETIIELLDQLSLNRLDASLRWTLNEWESRYAGVSLHHGIILNLAEDRRYLAEAKPVASLISKTLAPGVYLLSAAERPEAARALRRAGVDIIAQPSFPDGADWPGNPFPGLDSGESLSPPAPADSTIRKSIAPPPESSPSFNRAPYCKGSDIQEKFRSVLEKMRLSKHERDELSARIDRRLVLSEAQLAGASLRYEKLEALGLDYAGKSVIAKQAIQSGFMVEVSWQLSGEESRKVIGLVQALEKKEGESILVLRPVASEGAETAGVPADTTRIPGNTIRIPLGKISLLRRIKQSIFGE